MMCFSDEEISEVQKISRRLYAHSLADPEYKDVFIKNALAGNPNLDRRKLEEDYEKLVNGREVWLKMYQMTSDKSSAGIMNYVDGHLTEDMTEFQKKGFYQSAISLLSGGEESEEEVIARAGLNPDEQRKLLESRMEARVDEMMDRLAEEKVGVVYSDLSAAPEPAGELIPAGKQNPMGEHDPMEEQNPIGEQNPMEEHNPIGEQNPVEAKSSTDGVDDLFSVRKRTAEAMYLAAENGDIDPAWGNPELLGVLSAADEMFCSEMIAYAENSDVYSGSVAEIEEKKAKMAAFLKELLRNILFVLLGVMILLFFWHTAYGMVDALFDLIPLNLAAWANTAAMAAVAGLGTFVMMAEICSGLLLFVGGAAGIMNQLLTCYEEWQQERAKRNDRSHSESAYKEENQTQTEASNQYERWEADDEKIFEPA
ncbi:MAG: hypothetical protein LUG27_05575 [Clostridiales bacterium]|nr:hypothetical protein [Clostridiales bacterium]